jgi:hypothetical protein
MELKDQIEAAVGRSGADDPAVALDVRAERLRQELARSKALADRTEVVVRTAAGERRLVVFYEEGGWKQLQVPTKATRDERTDADDMRDLEDASIRGAADLLEAKYRTDQFRKEYLRGTPLDPTLFHDAFDLALRTWRESLTLSIRAQRSLTSALRDLVPRGPKRPSPRLWTEAPVRLRLQDEKSKTYEGRFVIRNSRATFLRCELKDHGAIAGAANVVFSPERLRLAPESRQAVTVRLTIEDPSSWSGTIEWSGDASLLAPVPLELPS